MCVDGFDHDWVEERGEGGRRERRKNKVKELNCISRVQSVGSQ